MGEPDDPCLSSEDPRGGKKLWIEIGNPSARRLHKASKAAKKVKIYTYKNPEALVREISNENIHNGAQLEIFSISADFLAELETALDRDNEWDIIRDQSSLLITMQEEVHQGELRRIAFTG